MTENNRNDFDDFFKDNKPQEQGTDENNQGTSSSNSDESTYYAYGPYRNSQGETGSKDQPIDVTPLSSQTHSSNNTQDAAPSPRPGRTFGYSDGRGNTSYTLTSGSGNSFTPPKKRSIMGYFTAFAAGVLLVGSMMWAADYNNWFTKGSVAATYGSSNQNTGSNNTDVRQSSLGTSRPDISGIVDKSSKAVVLIENMVKTKQTQGNSSNPLYNDWFRQFLGEEAPDNSQKQPEADNSNPGYQKQGMGTGFIFEDSGYILTNQHVIDGADQVLVTVEGYKNPFVAKVLGTSYELDLACLKIEGTEPFATLPLGNANDAKVGDWVVAIGNPYGFDHTVTVGVLSAKGRPISIPDQKGTRKYDNLFQTDASINPGNSGGPLLNMHGEVIGINTAVSSQAQGIGFAIPTTTVNEVIDSLKNNVQIPIPYIGVALGEIDKDWANELKLDSTDGALIGTVERKSPAFKAGIRPYDVVVDIDGKSIKGPTDLQAAVKSHKVGDNLQFGIIRDGEKITLSVTIGDKNDSEQANK